MKRYVMTLDYTANYGTAEMGNNTSIEITICVNAENNDEAYERFEAETDYMGLSLGSMDESIDVFTYPHGHKIETLTIEELEETEPVSKWLEKGVADFGL